MQKEPCYYYRFIYRNYDQTGQKPREYGKSEAQKKEAELRKKIDALDEIRQLGEDCGEVWD